MNIQESIELRNGGCEDLNTDYKLQSKKSISFSPMILDYDAGQKMKGTILLLFSWISLIHCSTPHGQEK